MIHRLLTTTSIWITVPIRLALGVVFIAHGSQKALGAFGGKGLASWMNGNAPLGLKPSWLWLAAAAFSELIGGILVLIGLMTRVGAFLIACVMVVAISGVHWGSFFNPSGFEYPMSLCAMALGLMISGGGALSVDLGLGGGSPSRRKYKSR